MVCRSPDFNPADVYGDDGGLCIPTDPTPKSSFLVDIANFCVCVDQDLPIYEHRPAGDQCHVLRAVDRRFVLEGALEVE